jgi:hypothetical protein
MAIQSTNNSQCQILWNRDLTQGRNAPLLQLPKEILELILQRIVSEPFPFQPSIHAIEFGRVCILTHLMTHHEDIQAIINREDKFDNGATEMYQLTHSTARSFPRALMGLPERAVIYPLYAIDKDTRNDALKVCFAVFKIMAQKHSIKLGSNEYLSCAGRVSEYFEGAGQSAQAFGENIFKVTLESYAKNPIQDITIESYKAEVARLHQAFANISLQDLEAELRRAIFCVHDQGLIVLRNEYRSGQHVPAAKYDLRERRISVRDSIDAELRILCGPNGSNGFIDHAYRRMSSAEIAMQEDKVAYTVALKESVSIAESGNGHDPVMLSFNHVSNAYYKYIHSHSHYTGEYDKHQALVAKLAGFAIWTNGVLTGGQKAEIEANLQDEQLSQDARAICQKKGDFYHQLSREINEENKAELYDDLHAIIDN